MKKILLLAVLILYTGLYAFTNDGIQEAFSKSYTYEKIQNYTDAIKAIMPVYQEYPNTYTVNLRLGWLYYLNMNYANSLDHYKKAIKIAPASLEAKLGQLLPLLTQERYKDVEKIAFQILSKDYYSYNGNLKLAYALRKQQKYDTAEKIALKMLNIYPTDVSFLTEYALAKHGQGDVDAAVKVFYNDVLILDPENVTAKGYLRK